MNPWLLVFTELSVPILFLVTLFMVNKTFKPIDTVSRGLSLIQDGDYSITLRKSSNTEANKIIEVYNAMINHLREERISVREKNHFLDLLLDSSPMGIVTLNLDEKIEDINPAACQFLNRSSEVLKGLMLKEVNDPITNELSKLEFGMKIKVDQADNRKYLLRKLFFMDHGFKHPFYLIEEFSDEIRQAEKTAYTKLIRMMTHEVNNTLGAVNSILSTIVENDDSCQEDEKDEVNQILGVALQRNTRLNQFMRNLSEVVKLPAPQKEEFNVVSSLNNVLLSLQHQISSKGIEIKKSFEEDIIIITADQNQMEQVFINVILNAIESIGTNGYIQIDISQNPLSVRFSDNGAGLSHDARDKVFTPFYSSKPDGQGVGLTLVSEILSNHGFNFKLFNLPEQGACFEIGIPT
jgi:two-component system nitrogen regulation sensor histidine kinase NtrY